MRQKRSFARGDRRSRRTTGHVDCVPVVWQALLAGFILFRVFDIIKPPPIRSLEKLPEGTGIVVDDLGAGVYGLIVLQVLLHFGVVR